jgi:predicted alpha/beta hydrolase
MIEEFEGASHELMLSRSVSSPAPASVTSPVHNRSNASFDAGIANISDIPVAASVKSSYQEGAPLSFLAHSIGRNFLCTIGSE